MRARCVRGKQKRRQQFGGKSGTRTIGFDRIRCNPVQARSVSVGSRMQTGASQVKMAVLSLSSGAEQNGMLRLWLHQLCRVLFNLRNVIICLRAN